MFGNLIVTATLKPPEQGNVPVQSPGVSIYAKDPNNTIYEFKQFLAPNDMIVRCTLSDSNIFLQVAKPDSNKGIDFTVLVYQRVDGSTMQWTQTQTIHDMWPATTGIVLINMQASPQNFLLVTNLYPNPSNLGNVLIYQKMKDNGQWMQSQKLSGVIDIYSSFPFLSASIDETTLVVSGFPGVSSNSSCATSVYIATNNPNPNQSKDNNVITWKFDYEMKNVLNTPKLAQNGLLASSTHNGIDLYNKINGKFMLVDSLQTPVKDKEYRGTTSLTFDSEGSFLVRGLGPYNYDSNSGCVVYSISKDLKINELKDTWGEQKLTMRCVAGKKVYGTNIWLSNDYYSLDLYQV